MGAANGFLIAPQSVTVADDDDISNITLSGQWVVDPGGGQGFLTSVVVGFNRSITSLVRGLRSALGEPAPAPDLTRGSLTQPEKLENCPCALAYWNEALFLQDLAHQKFDQIRRQFESNVDTNSLNLGKFGVDLGILAAQLALAGAAANSTKALGEADADFTQAVNQLNAGKLTPADFALTSQRLSQAFELAKAGAGADAIKSFVLGGVVPTVYQATVTKLQTNMNWLEAMANDVKSFSSALSTGASVEQLAQLGAAVQNDIAGVANLYAGLRALNTNLPGPISTEVGNLLNLFQPLADAASGLNAAFNNDTTLFGLEQQYKSLISQRDAAVLLADKALTNCIFEHANLKPPNSIPPPPHIDFHHFPPGNTVGVRSYDPNDIVGPAGYGSAGFVTPDETLPYSIDFTE